MTDFQTLRHNAHLSRAAAAEYLQVNLSTVNRSDNGKSKPPFAVLELLRLLAGGVPDLASRHAFAGWYFKQDYICTPEGEKFTAGDIEDIRFLKQINQANRVEISRLKAKIIELTPSGAAIDDTNVIKFPSRLSASNSN